MAASIINLEVRLNCNGIVTQLTLMCHLCLLDPPRGPSPLGPPGPPRGPSSRGGDRGGDRGGGVPSFPGGPPGGPGGPPPGMNYKLNNSCLLLQKKTHDLC